LLLAVDEFFMTMKRRCFTLFDERMLEIFVASYATYRETIDKYVSNFREVL
jgi:hypothetical protein